MNFDNTVASEDKKIEIDYKSYDDYLVMVKNNSNHNLVVFRNTPQEQNLLGGIPSGALCHKLNKNSELCSESQFFFLFFVKEDDYIECYNDLSRLGNKPFALLKAYYSVNQNNNTVYEILDVLGGDGCIVVYNQTPYIVDLHFDGISGIVLCSCPAQTYVEFKVRNNMSYDLYPVFNQINPTTNEVTTIYPTWKYGSLNGEPKNVLFELNAYNNTKNLYCRDWLDDDIN